MRGRPVVAAGASGLALVAVAVLFGGDVAVPGAPSAAPPSVETGGAVGAALPAVPTTPTATRAPTTPPSIPPSTKPAAPKTAAPERPAAPRAQAAGTVRLRGGGEARLVRTDLGPDATLPVPESLREATWWGADLAAAEGATVLAGHVNWRGRTGPFAELWDARVGDHVSVVDPAGKTWAYRVSEVVTLGKDELPARADALFGQSGPHRLVLVTCGGRWVGGSDGYESNRVVVALPA